MARLWQSGFESNSVTAGVELTGITGIAALVTSPVRTGTYALRAAPGPQSRMVQYRFVSTTGNGPYYVRAYIRLAAAPTSNDQRLLYFVEDGVADRSRIMIDSDRTLWLQTGDAEYSEVGRSSAISLNTWYRIELSYFNNTGSGFAEHVFKIDGTTIASTTTSTGTGAINAVDMGNVDGDTTLDVYFDDIAVNDSTGSFQNSFPGAGAIIHKYPDATGDNGDWTRGGSDSGANWSQVDEVTPNDGTDYVTSTTLNQIDDYNVQASGLSGTDAIRVVAIGTRFAGVEPNSAAYVLRVKASASGTVEESGNIDPNSTSYSTNAIANPRNYPLVLYDLPGASTTAWTATDLDAAQIGMRLSVAPGANGARVSSVWMSIDYEAGAGFTTSTSSTSSSVSTSSTSSSISTSSTSTSRSTSTSSTSTSRSTSTSSTSSSISTSSTSTSRSTSTSSTSTSRSTSTSSTSSSISTSSTSTSKSTSTSSTSSSISTSSTSQSTSISTSVSTSSTSTSQSTSTSSTSVSASTSTSSTSVSISTSTSTSESTTTTTSTSSTSISTSSTSTSTSSTTTLPPDNRFFPRVTIRTRL